MVNIACSYLNSYPFVPFSLLPEHWFCLGWRYAQFFKKTNTLLYYLPCHWAGGRGGVRMEHSGQRGYMSCWGVHWAVIEKSCFPATCAVSFLFFTFLLLFVWNEDERLEVELPCWTMRLGPHVTLVKQKDRGNLSTMFALSLSPLWTGNFYSIRMYS